MREVTVVFVTEEDLSPAEWGHQVEYMLSITADIEVDVIEVEVEEV